MSGIVGKNAGRASGIVGAGDIGADAVGLAELSATGTPSSSNFLRGDNAWAAAGGGKVVQVVNVMDTAVDSGTTVMFSDDTIPTITEGDEFMTLAITPTNASNKLIIQIVASLSHSSTGSDILTALYQDTTSAALAAVDNRASAGANNTQQPTNFIHYMAADTTSATTFSMC